MQFVCVHVTCPINIVTRVALTSSCRQYGDRSLLTEALSVTCWGEKHWWSLLAVGIPGLLLYVIIVPVLLARVLIAQRRLNTLYYWQDRYDPKWTLRYGFGESIVFHVLELNKICVVFLSRFYLC